MDKVLKENELRKVVYNTIKNVLSENKQKLNEDEVNEYGYNSHYGGGMSTNRDRQFLKGVSRLGDTKGLTRTGLLITTIINQITKQGSKIVNPQVGSVIVTALMDYAKNNRIRVTPQNTENFVKQISPMRVKQVLNMVANPNGHAMFSADKVNIITKALNEYLEKNKQVRYKASNESELIQNTLDLLQSNGTRLIGSERTNLLIKALNEYSQNHAEASQTQQGTSQDQGWMSKLKRGFNRLVSEEAQNN